MDEEEKKMRKLAEEADERSLPSRPPKTRRELEQDPLLLSGIIKKGKDGFYSMQTPNGAWSTNSLKGALEEAKRSLNTPPEDETDWEFLAPAGNWEPIKSLKTWNRERMEKWEKWRLKQDSKLNKLMKRMS